MAATVKANDLIPSMRIFPALPEGGRLMLMKRRRFRSHSALSRRGFVATAMLCAFAMIGCSDGSPEVEALIAFPWNVLARERMKRAAKMCQTLTISTANKSSRSSVAKATILSAISMIRRQFQRSTNVPVIGPRITLGSIPTKDAVAARWLNPFGPSGTRSKRIAPVGCPKLKAPVHSKW